MKIIEQTNRTIVFEKFSDEKYNILTLIGDVENIESLDDEVISEINDKLVVGSFEEFLLKFEPKIYSFMDVENKKISYTLEKDIRLPDNLYNEIPINLENSFIKMLITLIENRKSIDLKNIDFKFEDILDMLSPRRVIADIKQLRKDINYLYNKYEKLSDSNPKKLDLGDQLNDKFYQASKNYNNILAMLPLAIEDTKTKLSIGEERSSQTIQNIKAGLIEFSNDGRLEFIEVKNDEHELALVNDTRNELVEIFKEDYNQNSKCPNKYISDLICRTFVPMNLVEEIDFKKEVDNYNNYLELYKQAQDDFVKQAKSLIEKVLDIKVYFDQFDSNIEMKPKLLITNVENYILSEAKNLEKLDKFLNTVNTKNEFSNTIWFATITDIDMHELKPIQHKKLFASNDGLNQKNSHSLETVIPIIEILANYKIEVFISFEKNEETTFENLSTFGIGKYKEKTRILENKKYSEYVIPVIPNFTIIPKDKSGIKIDNKVEFNNEIVNFSEDKDSMVEFFINGIYIDSAFVAAAVVGSYQSPIQLKKRFKNVNINNPGVRFNIELDDNAYILPTSLPREISGFTSRIKEDINLNNYGFVFASEAGHVAGNKITNVTVYKARNLSKSSLGGYEGIYKTQTTTYIERVLRYTTNDFKNDKLNHFFSNSPTSQKTLWIKESGEVNSILNKGDDISHLIDETNNTCQLNLSFAGEVKNLKIEINKNN